MPTYLVQSVEFSAHRNHLGNAWHEAQLKMEVELGLRLTARVLRLGSFARNLLLTEMQDDVIRLESVVSGEGIANRVVFTGRAQKQEITGGWQYTIQHEGWTIQLLA